MGQTSYELVIYTVSRHGPKGAIIAIFERLLPESTPKRRPGDGSCHHQTPGSEADRTPGSMVFRASLATRFFLDDSASCPGWPSQLESWARVDESRAQTIGEGVASFCRRALARPSTKARASRAPQRSGTPCRGKKTPCEPAWERTSGTAAAPHSSCAHASRRCRRRLRQAASSRSRGEVAARTSMASPRTSRR